MAVLLQLAYKEFREWKDEEAELRTQSLVYKEMVF
jgi:hypothetical protein